MSGLTIWILLSLPSIADLWWKEPVTEIFLFINQDNQLST